MMTNFKTSTSFMANDYVVIGIAAGLIISAAYVNVITKINFIIYNSGEKAYVTLAVN